MKDFHRYLLRYTVAGHKAEWFTDFRLHDVSTKTVKEIIQQALDQCRQDAAYKLKKTLKDEDVSIKTFNLIDLE